MLALLGTFIDLTEDSIDFLYDFKSKFNLLNANWNAEWKYFVFPMMMLAECVCQHRDSGMTANNNLPLTGKHDKLRFMCSQVAGTISKFREILNQTKKCEILH